MKTYVVLHEGYFEAVYATLELAKRYAFAGLEYDDKAPPEWSPGSDGTSWRTAVEDGGCLIRIAIYEEEVVAE
jgi:hypothetical protein